MRKMKNYQVDVVVGGTYGDEGKGKCVNFLCQKNKYDYVFRVNASTNASHCVNLGDNQPEYVTKQLPSVFNQPGTKLVVSPGTFLNIKDFKEELKLRPDLEIIKGNVFVASSVPLILDLYREMSHKDSFRQDVGTTNQGTGIAMRERVVKNSIYLYDIYDLIKSDDFNALRKKLEKHISKLGVIDVNIENIILDLQKDLKEIYSMIGDFMTDYPNFIANELFNKKILIEGCNGILLDNIVGVRPYTTSCSTTLNALMGYASLSPFYVKDVFTIVGSYFVCLNKRPFPTEIDDEKVVEHILSNNAEIDKAENMQRRIGWFDLPALRRALLGCESKDQKSKIFLTKIDILAGLDEVKICTMYKIKDATYEIMPDNTNILEDAEPIYVTLPGWKSLDATDKESMKNMQGFCKFITTALGDEYTLAYISTGKESNKILINL